MDKRIEFHDILKSTLNSSNVYFQPPETIKMNYPAIVYSLSNLRNMYADNLVYIQKKAYNVILIEKNPDSETIEKLSKLPYSNFNTSYVADNLYHYSYTIYY